MKKSFLTFLFCLIIGTLIAQDYLISFAGDGANTTVDSVKVENLTQGTNQTMTGNQVLHLKSNITGVSPINQNQLPGIRFYPNPMTEFTQMEFDIPEPGFAQIGLYDISGRIITQTNRFLNEGRHTYQITGLGSGVYFVKIKSIGITLSGKLVSNNSVLGNPGITYTQSLPDKQTTETLKSATTEVIMQYTSGDWLKFTGISGNYRTVVTGVPTSSKNLTFTFIPCTDAGGKNYSVVKIGGQWWMAENLAYLPRVSPPTAGSDTVSNYYVYGYNGTDITVAKATANYTTYGVLYNWPAALTACPSGWHLPSDTEWTTLTTVLGGVSIAGGKMKESGTTHWVSPNSGATNNSGFSGLPGGLGDDYDGGFYSIGNYGYWWSSTEGSTTTAWGRDLYYYDAGVSRYDLDKDFGFSVRCVGNTIPRVSTKEISNAAITSATCGGNVTNDGGAEVTARGVCWNTTSNPTIVDSHTTDGSGLGEFTSSLTGLAPLTTYYVRAYATNKLGTAYGEEKSFTTIRIWSETGTFTDVRDGKTYKTVKIGNQWWMAENLAYLPAVSPANVGSNTTPYYYVYSNSGTDIMAAKATANYSTYGVLYNWPAAMNEAASSSANPSGVQGVCPTGWHLPSDAEWKQLEMALGMTQAQADGTVNRGTNQGTQMKTTTGWYGYVNGTNTSGFSGLPGGYRYIDGYFYYFTYNGFWWSSTETSTTYAWYRGLYCGYATVSRGNYGKGYGLSVRCVKDY